MKSCSPDWVTQVGARAAPCQRVCCSRTDSQALRRCYRLVMGTDLQLLYSGNNCYAHLPGASAGQKPQPVCVSPTVQDKTRISRPTQAGICHSAPAHRGGHIQNMRRRGEQRRSRYRTEPQAEQPRADARPSRKVQTCRQHGSGRRQPGARRRRHTKQGCRDRSQTLRLDVPRGVTSQCSSRVEEERDKTRR